MALTQDELERIVVRSVFFLASILTPDNVRNLANEKSAKATRKKIYQKMICDLPDPEYVAVLQILSRFQLYAQSEANALAQSRKVLFPRSKTNLDFTLRQMWVRKCQTELNKIRLLDEENEDVNPYDDFLRGLGPLLAMAASKFQEF